VAREATVGACSGLLGLGLGLCFGYLVGARRGKYTVSKPSVEDARLPRHQVGGDFRVHVIRGGIARLSDFFPARAQGAEPTVATAEARRVEAEDDPLIRRQDSPRTLGLPRGIANDFAIEVFVEPEREGDVDMVDISNHEWHV
jgi:hypothetical protein